MEKYLFQLDPAKCEDINPNPEDRIICINISQTYLSGERENVYECTRKYWRLNGYRAEKANIVLAIYRGVVVAVFKPHIWYLTKSTEYSGRWEFEGEQIYDSPYINTSVRNLVKIGQNPIMYYNCD